MGLLDKTNPHATPWSVLRRAFVMGLIGAALYLLAMIWKDGLRDHRIFGLITCTCLCAFVGGLWEWKVHVENEEDDCGYSGVIKDKKMDYVNYEVKLQSPLAGFPTTAIPAGGYGWIQTKGFFHT